MASAPHGERQSTLDWLDDRLGIGGLRYPVPSHANSLPYTLGGVTLVSFVLLVATGIYLGQFYDPGSVEEAHTSVFAITDDEVFAGGLVRSLHFWLATLFTATLVLHMVRTFVSGAFKAPREFVWVTGVLLFGLAAAALFTGTVLKADQEAVEALEHNNEIADFFGVFGFWFSADFSDAVDPLQRLYIAHVTIVPALIVALVAAHLLLIKRHRMAPLPWGSVAEVAERERQEHPVPFTSHLRHIGKWATVVVGVALVLAGALPAPLGPQGVEGIEITKPPWYFLWLYQPENWFGLNALWMFSAALFVGLLAMPLLDRSPERDPRRRRLWLGLGLAVIVAWVILTIVGATTEVASHVGMEE
jgi:quinol-cytochrome oxidoreductase complex cytochrome b subunit